MSDLDSMLPSGFRVISGFPRYAIDENGTILSICARNGRGKDRPWENATRMAFTIDKDGYQQVQLTHNGHPKCMRVHALVLIAFVGPCPDGMQCRHLDGNPTNNHVSNLAWGTPLENALDTILHGTVGIGDKNGRSILNADDVLQIRSRAANGESQRVIAKDFAVTQANISLIVRRKKWTHI